MRLWKAETKQRAMAELVKIVAANPGIRTSELRGTPEFHGVRTLSSAQIIALLREAGLTPTQGGYGARTFYTWKMPANTENVSPFVADVLARWGVTEPQDAKKAAAKLSKIETMLDDLCHHNPTRFTWGR